MIWHPAADYAMEIFGEKERWAMWRYKRIIPQQRNTAVALGCFDGVHLGHAQVLENALKGRRRGLSPAVFTFASGGGDCACAKRAKQLMSQSMKEGLLSRMGFDSFYAVDFVSVRGMEPEAFVEKVLFRALRAKEVFCGFNYRFGKDGRGDTALLRRLCRRYGIRAEVSPAVLSGDIPVSSTWIRDAVAQGDMAQAQALLGRPFAIDFKVAQGNRIGRLLGTPTINQPFPPGFVLPRFGVYGSAVTVCGKRYHGVTNVGVKPTVGSDTPLAETWIAGFDGDLYGRRVVVELLGFLRPEQKFESLDALKNQIHSDAERAKKLLEEAENMGNIRLESLYK